MNGESTPEFRAELKRLYDRARDDFEKPRDKKRDEGEEGTGGVREPRTPKPSAPAGEVALVLN